MLEVNDLRNLEGKNPRDYIALSRQYTNLKQNAIAITILEDGLTRCDPDQELYSRAIFTLEESNRTEDAIRLAGRAKQLFPSARFFEFWEALMLPVLYQDSRELERYRTRYSIGLGNLLAGLRLETARERKIALDAVNGHLNFYLGYQGLDDRKLQERYGQLLHKIMAASYPEWVKPLDMPPVASGGRIRVGYVSAHFREHSVTKLFKGWLTERNRDYFEVFVYHAGRTVDRVTEKIRRASDHFYHIPHDLEGLCRTILSDKLHIAVYLDVRHRIMSMMSALRLAPAQCVAWAHPITSGSPMIDYYLSSDLMEPEDGQQHYCERLIRLPGIGVYYPRPVIPRPLLQKSRSDFGLDANRIVYLCCQSIFKYLPQHDDIFVRIAKQVPAAQFVFLSMNDVVAREFARRLQSAFAPEGLDASNYCVILQQLTPFDYWNLNLLSDVFLDSLEWSGGVTTLEAIPCGLPIVTLPGRFMRGRHSYGILKRLGTTETIARDKESYVDIAARLGLDRNWRAGIIERMSEHQSQLYSNTESVAALEEQFRAMANCLG